MIIYIISVDKMTAIVDFLVLSDKNDAQSFYIIFDIKRIRISNLLSTNVSITLVFSPVIINDLPISCHAIYTHISSAYFFSCLFIFLVLSPPLYSTLLYSFFCSLTSSLIYSDLFLPAASLTSSSPIVDIKVSIQRSLILRALTYRISEKKYIILRRKLKLKFKLKSKI